MPSLDISDDPGPGNRVIAFTVEYGNNNAIVESRVGLSTLLETFFFQKKEVI